MTRLLNLIVSVALVIYTCGFIHFRLAEIRRLFELYHTQSISVLIGTTVIQFSSIGRTSKRIMYLLTVAGMIYLMDFCISGPLPPPSNKYAGKTVVITGGNSGLGYETARQLAVDYGMTVILGCRSKIKCENAADSINAEVDKTISSSKGSTYGKAIPMVVDLSDFKSVQSFGDQLVDTRIDTLFNNAGYIPKVGESVNSYGLDPSFTSMHLSHFLLTEALLKHNPQLRVVNTSASRQITKCAYYHAKYPQWLLDRIALDQNPGCIDADFLNRGIYTETDSAAYKNAKMANVMHAIQIPLHHPQATAVAIQQGWVGTNIQSFMQGILTPTNLGWMRRVNIGVLPIMQAILSSDEELLNEKKNLMKSGRTWSEGGVIMNVFGQTQEAFTVESWWKEELGLGRKHMMELSRGLWEASEELTGKYLT